MKKELEELTVMDVCLEKVFEEAGKRFMKKEIAGFEIQAINNSGETVEITAVMMDALTAQRQVYQFQFYTGTQNVFEPAEDGLDFVEVGEEVE